MDQPEDPMEFLAFKFDQLFPDFRFVYLNQVFKFEERLYIGLVILAKAPLHQRVHSCCLFTTTGSFLMHRIEKIVDRSFLEPTGADFQYHVEVGAVNAFKHGSFIDVSLKHAARTLPVVLLPEVAFVQAAVPRHNHLVVAKLAAAPPGNETHLRQIVYQNYLWRFTGNVHFPIFTSLSCHELI